MADDTSTASTGSGSETKVQGTAVTATASSPRPPAARKATARKATPAKATARKATPRKATPGAKASAASRKAPAVSRRAAAAPKPEIVVAPAPVDAHAGSMTPTIALARHLEWLEYAIGAARAEEGWRRTRLGKASKSNLAKREMRLADVVAEITELSALILGLRDLQRRATSKSTSGRPSAPRTRTSTGTAPRSRRTTATGAG
jgi:hypothetical protein